MMLWTIDKGNPVKSIVSLILTVVIACTPVFAMPKHPESTAQRKAAHQIVFETTHTEDGVVEIGKALCTASAIGPHALLTATHCDAGETTLQVDHELITRTILGRITDGEDHTIFLIDGPAYKDTMGRFYSTQDTIGDKVFMYGDGGRMYPPMYRTGYRMGSEVMEAGDVPEGMPIGELYIFDMNIVGGDSGSAIY